MRAVSSAKAKLQAATFGLDLCYPSDPHGDDVVSEVVAGSGFCNEFDRMNAGGYTHSSGANMEANPDGSKVYSVWAQWVFAPNGEEIVESDAIARRMRNSISFGNPQMVYDYQSLIRRRTI